MKEEEKKNIIIYHTADGKARVSLYAKDGTVWMNQTQLAELFDTSKQNIGQHIASILKENELNHDSVIKNFFTTAADGKEYMLSASSVFHQSVNGELASRCFVRNYSEFIPVFRDAALAN